MKAKTKKAAKKTKPRKPKVLHGVLWYSVGFERWEFDPCQSRQEAEDLAKRDIYWAHNRPKAVKAVIP